MISISEEKRTLIETYLPIEEISEEAKKEKQGEARPHSSFIHFWWTRKPLIAARAAIYGALLSENFNPIRFQEILGLNKKKRAYNYLPNIEEIKKESNKIWGENPSIYDPFAGGGSIPLEALRIGLNIDAYDYSPVAWLILMGTLKFPLTSGTGLENLVNRYYQRIIENTKKEIEYLYPKHNGKTVLSYIYSWNVNCPKCNAHTPLVGSWWLSKNTKNKKFLKPIISKDKISFSIESHGLPPDITFKKRNGLCINCGSTLSQEVIIKAVGDFNNEKLLAVVLEEKNGKSYDLPSNEDINALKLAQKTIQKQWTELIDSNLIPLEEMPMGTVRSARYLKQWYNILNVRQLVLFTCLIKNMKKELADPSLSKTDRELIAVYYSLLLGKHINRNCRLSGWITRNASSLVSPAITNRGLSIIWDHVEVNPFSNSSGTLSTNVDDILKAIKFCTLALKSPVKGNLIIGKKSILSSDSSKKYDLIITDPPYLDDVQYSELSEFFYIWESRVIDTIFPQIFENYSTPKSEDLSVSNLRDEKFFKKGFEISCKKLWSSLKENGMLILFFAHSSIEAWDFVITALMKSGFRITATWPIHTESEDNPMARGHASIMSSIIIVARKRTTDNSGYIEDIQNEVEQHLKKRLNEFWDYNLRGSDLTVSAMGATLDIITQYSDIKSYTGEKKIKDILELVQKYVADYVLARYVENVSGLDSQTAFYLYTRLSGLDGMPFDTANLIFKSLNVDIKKFEQEGLIQSITKGKSKGIKLLKYNEREHIGMISLIDAVHFIMVTFKKGGYADVERVVNNIPYSRNDIKSILVAFQSFSPDDPERQISQKILERMGYVFPKEGQRALEDY